MLARALPSADMTASGDLHALCSLKRTLYALNAEKPANWSRQLLSTISSRTEAIRSCSGTKTTGSPFARTAMTERPEAACDAAQKGREID